MLRKIFFSITLLASLVLLFIGILVLIDSNVFSSIGDLYKLVRSFKEFIAVTYAVVVLLIEPLATAILLYLVSLIGLQVKAKKWKIDYYIVLALSLTYIVLLTSTLCLVDIAPLSFDQLVTATQNFIKNLDKTSFEYFVVQLYVIVALYSSPSLLLVTSLAGLGVSKSSTKRASRDLSQYYLNDLKNQ